MYVCVYYAHMILGQKVKIVDFYKVNVDVFQQNTMIQQKNRTF